MKNKILISFIAIILVAGLGIAGYFIYKNYFSKKSELPKEEVKKLTLGPEKEATHLSKVADTKGAYWMRGLPFTWNEIEHEKGKFNWEKADEGIKIAKEGVEDEIYNIAMIWPYANWDQKTCHQGDKYKATGHLKESNEELMMGAPCDMKAYASFLEKVVERYDGDGIDDMPGLKTPIKYWEIMNEPEMQGGGIGGAGEELKFFVGTPQEYLEILKTSYETIKKADSEAKVAHAGMAGMQKNFQDFWDPVFAGGAGNYFDIANIHTISTDEGREDLYVISFKKFLEKYGIKDKPIWITEVQFGQLMEKPKDLQAFERLMAKSSVFALAHGADKLFYIENWTMWDNPDAFKPPEEENKDGKDKKEKGPKPKLDLENNSTHKVYLNLVDKTNSFDKIEILKEEFTESKGDNDGATSRIGQYKFIKGGKVVYVLWGQAELPEEITAGPKCGTGAKCPGANKVKVTDIYGVSQETDANAIQFSDFPIFVEKI